MNQRVELFPSLETRRFFTVTEAARLLGMSVPGIHVWISKGRIRRPPRASKRGGYRIPREEIVRLLRSARREVAGLWAPKRRRVLLIEDDAQVRAVVAAALRDPNFETQVETAATPEDGLLLAAQLKPDLILLDHFQPKEGMTSDQALAILRRAKTVKGVKIIGLWSAEAPRTRERTPRPDAFLPKPFGPQDLRGAVLGLLAGAPALHERSGGAPGDRRRWEYRVSHRSPDR